MKNLQSQISNQKSSIREISQSELNHVNGGIAWIPIAIAIASLLIPANIGRDKRD